MSNNSANKASDDAILRNWSNRRTATAAMNLRSLLFPVLLGDNQTLISRTAPRLEGRHPQHFNQTRDERCRFLIQTMDEALRLVDETESQLSILDGNRNRNTVEGQTSDPSLSSRNIQNRQGERNNGRSPRQNNQDPGTNPETRSDDEPHEHH
jgi:hypothetical protein